MANSILLDTLNEHLKEIGEEQQQIRAAVTSCRTEVEHRRAALQSVKDETDCAIYEDEQIVAKHKALLEHYNRSEDKPQILLDNILKLQAAQSTANRHRQHKEGILKQEQQDLQKTKTRLAVAEQRLARIQGNLQEITQEILAVQRNS